MKFIISLTLFLFAAIPYTETRSKGTCNPYDITLQTTEDKPQSLLDNKKLQATVFVFLLPDCPACQSYSIPLNTLSKKYGSKIKFIGVVPGDYSTNEEIKSFVSEYQLQFPIYKDDKNILVKCLKATIVPEVFLVSKNGVTLYSGRIDNWMASLAKKKLAATTHDLQDALASVVSGQPVKVRKTKAVGCFIE